MEFVGYFIFFLFFAFLLVKLVIEPEIKLRKKIDALKKIKISDGEIRIENEKNNFDFHGTELLKNDQELFLKKLDSKRKKIMSGEGVGVNAAEAFFLIRNSRHNGMIISEDGTINIGNNSNVSSVNHDNEIENLRKQILEYQPSGRSVEDINKKIQIPPYVKEVQQLSCGGFRWVYQQWHAEECGIKSQCFDRYSRPMPDPDIENDNCKKQKRGNHESREYAGGNLEVKDLSKKISRVLEMEEERRADVMLAKSKQQIASDDTQCIQEDNVSTLTPHPYKDELELLEEENAIPDYMSIMKGDEDFVNELEADLQMEDHENSYISQKQAFQYENKNLFINEIENEKDFLLHVIEDVCSHAKTKSIFYDDTSRMIFIEKNCFVRSIINFIEPDHQRRFKSDFLVDGTIELYDGNKINELLEAMNQDEHLERISKTVRAMLFNMLFSSNDAKGKYYAGWYIKIKLHAIPFLDGYVNENAESVDILGSHPKEIKRKISLLDGVEVSY